MRPINRRSPLPDIHHSMPLQGLGKHENIRRPVPLVFIIFPHGLTRTGRNTRSCLLDQLHRLLIHAYQGNFRIVWHMIYIQDILHMSHKVPASFRRDYPHLLQMRTHLVFLSACLTVSWLIVSTIPNSTALSASSRKFHRLYPSGGFPHLNAMSLVSASPSSLYARDGRSCFFRESAPSSPLSTNRCLTARTVFSQTEKLSTIFLSDHAGPSASAFKRILACLLFICCRLSFCRKFLQLTALFFCKPYNVFPVLVHAALSPSSGSPLFRRRSLSKDPSSSLTREYS